MLEKIFKLSANKTDAKTEVLAGITTFMTMAYILAVNPNILSATGMDSGAVFTATALAAFLGTLLMAIFANYPFALAPGMGLNAYFAYTVVIGMGYSWRYRSFYCICRITECQYRDRRLHSAAAFLCRWLQRSQGCRGFLQQCGDHRYPGSDRYHRNRYPGC